MHCAQPARDWTSQPPIQSNPIQHAHCKSLAQPSPAQPGLALSSLVSRLQHTRPAQSVSVPQPGLRCAVPVKNHLGYRPMGAAAQALHSQAARQLKYSGLVLGPSLERPQPQSPRAPAPQRPKAPTD